jgi:hypothetical protein
MVKIDKKNFFFPHMTIHIPNESPDCVDNKNDVLENI